MDMLKKVLSQVLARPQSVCKFSQCINLPAWQVESSVAELIYCRSVVYSNRMYDTGYEAISCVYQANQHN